MQIDRGFTDQQTASEQKLMWYAFSGFFQYFFNGKANNDN